MLEGYDGKRRRPFGTTRGAIAARDKLLVHAMANVIRYSATEIAPSGLTTEMNSLASATLTVAGPLIHNSFSSAGRHTLVDLELLAEVQ